MLSHHGERPALITTAPESPAEEYRRRRRRYAIMAVIFVGCFAAGGITYRHTLLASALEGVAVIMLIVAVFAANFRSRPHGRTRRNPAARRERALPPHG